MNIIKKIVSAVKVALLPVRVAKPSVPAFQYSFSSLNPSEWEISTWGAPQANATHVATFAADHVSIVDGMLCLKLSQENINGVLHSTGGELSSTRKFGYGTYEFTVRDSSTSQTLSDPGTALSGAITGCFNYLPGSATEIDVEIQGRTCGTVEFTSWVSEKAPSESTAVTPSHSGTPELRAYKFIWIPGKIDYFIDGSLVHSHSTVVPHAPAPFMFNHWGTNNDNWGGTASLGVDRFMFIKDFKFTPLA